MKALVVFILLLCSLWAKPSLEVMGGGITYHFPYDFNIVSGPGYKVALSPDGLLIFNPLAGLKLLQNTNNIYYGGCVYSGLNSLAYPMVGAYGCVGWNLLSNWLQFGFVAGGYFFFSPRAPTFMPVAGIELNVRIPLGDKLFFKINTLVTPLLINNSISFGIVL